MSLDANAVDRQAVGVARARRAVGAQCGNARERRVAERNAQFALRRRATASASRANAASAFVANRARVAVVAADIVAQKFAHAWRDDFDAFAAHAALARIDRRALRAIDDVLVIAASDWIAFDRETAAVVERQAGV